MRKGAQIQTFSMELLAELRNIFALIGKELRRPDLSFAWFLYLSGEILPALNHSPTNFNSAQFLKR